MTNEQVSDQEARTEFFISYASTDRRWAEWIAWHLEEAGYRVIIEAWDVQAGNNLVLAMDEATRQAERTIAVLSPDYFTAQFTPAQWTAAFSRDPRGEQGTLLPIRVRSCHVEGFLGQIAYLDLVDRSEQEALTLLKTGVQRDRHKPAQAPVFPSTPKPERFPGALPPIWNVPYPRNVYFTGREDLLQLLAANLRTGQTSAVSQPQAMTGLGGIGKTQIALEYAYRYYQDYEAVLWVLADTRENLTSSYLTVASLLDLPEKGEQESARVVDAVKHWLQRNRGWLLILDNADDLALVREFLPPSVGGHVLLTTRAHTTGRFARRIEVDVLSTEVGALFLLQRAGLLPHDAPLEQAKEEDRTVARATCEDLGGLPLALDQAGAYIEETGCGLTGYLKLYQQRRAKLLAERRSQLVDDHPLPVATTWSLSFAQVEQKNAVAADLLRVCAFLAPDAIPEDIVTRGAEHLGPSLAEVGTDPYLLNQAIEALHAYSLLHREQSSDGIGLLSVHRLVQAVVRDQISKQDQHQWIERVVSAVSAIFPSGDHPTWPLCDRLLPHALVSADLIEQEQLGTPEAAHLFARTGYYLQERGRYPEAEPLWVRALSIRALQSGLEDPDTASILNCLAVLYQAQGNYEQAEQLYMRSLAIYEQELGPQHPDTALSLNNLATLYQNQGNYEQAEQLYVRSLAIYEQELGPQHPDTASILNYLAGLYRVQGKSAQAEPLLVRALEICEQQLGPQHPSTATGLNNLAELYRVQGKYEQAEPLSRRALSIREQELGPQHPDTARSLRCLATLSEAQHHDQHADTFYQRAYAIFVQALGPQHPDTKELRAQYASFLRARGRDTDAAALEQEDS